MGPSNLSTIIHPSTKSSKIILDNDDNNRSTVEVADNSQQNKTIRIRLPQSPFNDTINNKNVQLRLIPQSTVSTVNYQCGRLPKAYLITMEYQERESATLQSLPTSPQIQTINT